MTVQHDIFSTARSCAAAPDRVRAAFETVNRVLAAVQKRHKLRRTSNGLDAVNAQTLKDIGLDRSENMCIGYGGQARRTLNYWL